MPDYEVKILIKPSLSFLDKQFINNEIEKTAKKFNMYLHEDGVTYSKKPPYKKLEDIPAGFQFYLHLKKFKEYFSLFEYYSYLEGDINGRIIRCSNKF